MAAFAYRLAFLLAGSLVPCAAQAQTYSWNTTSGTWDTTTANWAGAGSTWTNSSSNTAAFANSTASGTVTVNGSITSGTIFLGNSSNRGNYTFTNGTSGSLSAAAFIANGAAGSGFNARLQNLTLTTSGNLAVGRDAKLVIGGSSTVVVGGTIGGQIGPISDASWGLLTIQDNAVVTATGGVNGNAEAWGLNLNGGTLYAPSIQASDREDGGTGRLTFNGTRVVATTSTSSFVTVGANHLATNSALVNSGGAIIDTNGFDVGVAINLKNGTSSGSLTKFGAGTLTLSGTTSDYSGGTTINAGTLVMAGGSALGAAGGSLAVNGGTLDLRGRSLSVGLLTGSSGGLITSNTAGSIILTASSASSGTFAGSLANGSGTLGLTKSGAGTLTLSGSNSFSGGTVVNAGVLSVASSEALPGWNVSGQVTVNSGGQIAVGNAFSDADVTTMLSTGSNFRAGSSIGFDTSAGNRTYAGNLGDAAQGELGLVKAGANTLVLSGSNSHTGGTTINAGTLQVGNASALGPATGSITLSGGALDLNGYSVTAGLLSSGSAGTISTSSAAASTLTVGSSGSSIYAGVIANGSGTVGIVKQNAGVLTLSNTASTYSGVTTINGGTLDVARLANGGANSSIGAASNAAANLVIDGGVLRYTGATAQSTNRLVTIGLNGATFDSSGSATVVFSNAGSVAFAGSGNRTITFAGTYGAGNNQFGALIANSGGTTSVLKTGTGTWLLGVNNGPNNTYTGSTTILAGTLIGGAWNGQQGFGNTSAIYLGDTSGTNNATVQFGTGVATAFTSVPIVVQSGNTGTATIVNFTNNSIQGSVTLGSANSSGKSVVIRNIGDFRWTPFLYSVIQDPTGLIAGTAGTVIFDNADVNGDAATWRIAGANTYTGDTRLLSGSMTVTNGNAFQNSTLDLGFAGDTGAVVWNQNSTLGGLKGTRNLDTSGSVLSIGNNNQSTSYSGVLSGSGGLTKIGTGMLTLSGSNTFTGATTVSAGTLSVGHAAALGANSGNLIASGGVLDLGGFGISRSGTVSFTGGTVQSGTLTNDTVAFDGRAGTVSATLAGAAGLTKSGAGTLSLTGSNGYTGPTIINGGTVAFAYAGDQTLSGTISGAGSLAKSGAGTLTLTASNSYSGSTVVNGGLIAIATKDALPGWNIADRLTVASGGGILVGNGFVDADVATMIATGSNFRAGAAIGFDTTAGDRTYANNLGSSSQGSLGLTKSGANTLTISGSSSFTGPTLINAGTVSFTFAGNQSVSGGISGAGGLAKSGTGALSLTGSNSYAGGTVVNAGVLAVASKDSLPGWNLADKLTVNSGGGVAVGNAFSDAEVTTMIATGSNFRAGAAIGFDTTAGDRTYASNFVDSPEGALVLTKSGANTLSLTGSNSYTGGTVVNAGVLNVASKDALPGWDVADKVTVNSGGGIAVGNAFSDADVATMIATGSNFRSGAAIGFDTTAGNRTYTSSLVNSPQGALGLAKAGANTLTLSGSNSYTGPTLISGGTVAFAFAGNQSLTGTISGAGSLAKSGAGTLTLGVMPTLTGTVTVSAGTLKLPNAAMGSFMTMIDGGTLDTSNGGTWGNNTVRFGQNGGTLSWGGANWYGTGTMTVISTAGAPSSQMIGTTYLNLAGRTVNFTANGDINLNAPLANVGSIIKGGTGTLILAANAHGGGTQGYRVFIDAGTLRASVNDALGGTGDITFRGGTLQYNAASPSDWSSRIRNSGSAIAVDTNGRSITWSGTINSTNTGGLRKLGSGTLSLSGSNAYSGGTWIDVGTLIAGHTNAFGSGAIALASGATFDLNSLSIANAITNSGGTIVGALNFTGTTTLTSGTSSLAGIGGTVDINATAVADLSGTIDADVTVKTGGRGRALGQIRKNVAVAGGANFDILDGASIDDGASFSFANNGQIHIDRTTALTLSKVISGTGGLRKSGSSLVHLTGQNTFTGATQVDAGALIVNGALAGDVVVASGATLGGSGVLGDTLSGAGLISVGNSPGIGTAGSVDPFLGTDWAFEITGTAPIWNSGTSASDNDVLRLTDATPFVNTLTSSNVVDILFNLGATPAAAGSYLGGFFVDNMSVSELTTALAGGQFRYWVAGTFGTAGDQQAFNVGSGGTPIMYSLLSVYDPALTAGYTVTQQTVNFGATNVTGAVTQFVIVPEPSTAIVAGIGIAMTGWSLWKRRRIRRVPKR